MGRKTHSGGGVIEIDRDSKFLFPRRVAEKGIDSIFRTRETFASLRENIPAPFFHSASLFPRLSLFSDFDFLPMLREYG